MDKKDEGGKDDQVQAQQDAVPEEPKEDSTPEPPRTAEEFIAQAPPEMREVLESGLKMHRERKSKLVQTLLGNKRNKFTKEQLEAKSMDELEALVELGQVEVDYSGQSGPAAENSPKVHERQPDGTGVPEMPRIQWN